MKENRGELDHFFRKKKKKHRGSKLGLSEKERVGKSKVSRREAHRTCHRKEIHHRAGRGKRNIYRRAASGGERVPGGGGGIIGVFRGNTRAGGPVGIERKLGL